MLFFFYLQFRLLLKMLELQVLKDFGLIVQNVLRVLQLFKRSRVVFPVFLYPEYKENLIYAMYNYKKYL